MMKRQQGIVLVLVLWALVLLLVIVSAVTSSVHTESTLAHHQLDQSRFHALADAAFYYGAARGYDPDVESAWSVNGEPYEWRFNGVDMEIRLIKASQLLDLNRATAQQLRLLLEALEIDADLHESLVDAILDWRDNDSLHRLNGAEDDAYQQAGRAYGAKDAPFTTVDELGLVLGVTSTIQTKLMPYLTVSATGKTKKFAVMDFAIGGGDADNAIVVMVEIADGQNHYRAKAIVSRSKRRFKLHTVNYAVPSVLWPEFDEEN